MQIQKTVLAFSALVAVPVAMAACSHPKETARDAVSKVSSSASAAGNTVSSVVSSALAAPAKTVEAPGVGSVVLDGPVAEAFNKAGGEGKLGLPTAQPEKIGDGVAQPFAHGTIYSSPSTGAHLVQGEILKVYIAHGGPAGELGFPTASEAQTAGGPFVAHGGWISEFQHGTITWLNQGDGSFKGTVSKK
jgi:uncharacterized protein with LGFP repeats